MRNYDFPGNVVSWAFDPIAGKANPEQSVGILVPVGTPNHIKIIAFNLEKLPVKATMTGWEIDPGKWEMTIGTQAKENGPVTGFTSKTVAFERSSDLPITFAPGVTTVIELTLKEKGVPYWSRPDLGIGSDDVKVDGNSMNVTVHSLGAIDAPEAKVVLRDRLGKIVATAGTPALQAPKDLLPKTATVSLAVPADAILKGMSVTIESSSTVPETTQKNNRVVLR